MQDSEFDTKITTIPLDIPEDLLESIELAIDKIKLGFEGIDGFILYATRKYLQESLELRELMKY